MVEFGQVFADNGRILPIECGKRGEGAGLKRIRRVIASKYEAIKGAINEAKILLAKSMYKGR